MVKCLDHEQTYLPNDENQNSCKRDAGFGSGLLLTLDRISDDFKVSKYFSLKVSSPKR